MKKAVKIIILIVVNLTFPITFIAAFWMKLVKKAGIGFFNYKIFSSLKVFPVLDQYYEPLVNPKKHLKKSLREDRVLKGIDLNEKGQLKLLSEFNYNIEIKKFPFYKKNEIEFYFNNTTYKSGDAEYLYNIIRHFKPKRVIEIGSGFSTLMAQNAIKQNTLEDSKYHCNHICIEPYEMPWLKELNVNLIREKVENIDTSFFKQLEKDDILFIDSSHIIRPQGDVLFEYLEILPTINSGVIVHIHDIFTPKDYLDDWIYKDFRLWNEQYLLEAFLMFNSEFKIIGALNYLAHNHPKEFKDKCPIFANEKGREPGSFWIVKN
jgi:hypothetical protein